MKGMLESIEITRDHESDWKGLLSHKKITGNHDRSRKVTFIFPGWWRDFRACCGWMPAFRYCANNPKLLKGSGLGSLKALPSTGSRGLLPLSRGNPRSGGTESRPAPLAALGEQVITVHPYPR